MGTRTRFRSSIMYIGQSRPVEKEGTRSKHVPGTVWSLPPIKRPWTGRIFIVSQFNSVNGLEWMDR
jgi:hypothetical protein